MNIKHGVFEYPEYGVVLRQTMFKVKEDNIYMIILNDITAEATQEKITMELKEETLQVTQNVIEKQMRIAQEIASLLGETTAETKIALNRLKNTMFKESNGDTYGK